MKPARLILVRHAESEGNAGKVVQGAGEYPLSERGRLQALTAATGISLLGPDLVASSDLSRASDTAMLAAGRVDIIDPRLRERGAGPWEGRPRADLEAAFPGSLEDDSMRPEGFEPVQEVVGRMRAACMDLLARNLTVVAFAHGAVLQALDNDLGGTGARFGHLDALELGPDLRIIGRTGYLEEK